MDKSQADVQAFNEASQQSIIAGGLPLNAIARLKEQESRIGTPQEFWTSDLGVNEFLLTKECGFEPLGQVMGSSVYNVGYQYVQGGFFYSSQELTALTHAHYEARRLAFNRLQQEAALLKADGVVGVRFHRKGGGLWDGQMLEYFAIGTAVRLQNAPPLAPGTLPFVSNLSGQDHWALRKGGYKPVGFTFGNCTWCQYADWRSQSAMMSWSNVELTSLTQGLYTARALAMSRMNGEAMALRSEGVVGVTVEMDVQRIDGQNNNVWYLMTFSGFGTAIAPDTLSADYSGKPIQTPTLQISLLDKR